MSRKKNEADTAPSCTFLPFFYDWSSTPYCLCWRTSAHKVNRNSFYPHLILLFHPTRCWSTHSELGKKKQNQKPHQPTNQQTTMELSNRNSQWLHFWWYLSHSFSVKTMEVSSSSSGELRKILKSFKSTKNKWTCILGKKKAPANHAHSGLFNFTRSKGFCWEFFYLKFVQSQNTTYKVKILNNWLN